jgi:hypothetical protein
LIERIPKEFLESGPMNTNNPRSRREEESFNPNKRLQAYVEPGTVVKNRKERRPRVPRA